MNPKPLLVAGAVLLGIGFIAYRSVDRGSQAIRKEVGAAAADQVRSVTVEAPVPRDLEETVEVSGDVATAQDVQVGFKASGKIVAVSVADGDRVSAGQTLATLDASTVLAQTQQAQAGLQQALANLAQQRTNAALAPGRTIAAVRQAEAGVRSARASLSRAQTGARSEERRQAEAQVASAQSDVKTTASELNRIRTLVTEGALAGNRLEQQQNVADQARARLVNAQQALATLTNGTRPEEIAVAREAVRQAQAQLENARASRALDATYADQVAAAQAQVESARAALRIQQQALADTRLVAPISGRVFGKPLQAGTVVSPGLTVVRIIGEGGVYFEGQVPSARLASVRPGQPVRTTVDALPGRTFSGRVESLAPLGQTSSRIFNARIALGPDAASARPGMFARGVIVVRRDPGALTLPTSAIVSSGGESYVYLEKSGKARRQRVTSGLALGDRTQVRGLAPDARVIVRGAAELVEGDSVRIEAPAASAQSIKTPSAAR